MRKQDEEKKVGIVFVADHWGTYTGGIDVFNENLCKEMAYVVDQTCVSVICLVLGVVETYYSDECKKQGIILVDYRGGKDEPWDEMAIRIKQEIINQAPCKRYIWIGHDIVTGEQAYKMSKLSGKENTFILILHTAFNLTHIRQKKAFITKDEDNYVSKAKRQKKLAKQADCVLCVGPLVYESFENVENANMIIPGLNINNRTDNIGRPRVIMTSGRFSAKTMQQKNWIEFFDGIGKALDILMDHDRGVMEYQIIVYGFSEEYDDDELETLQKQMVETIEKKTRHKVSPTFNFYRFDEKRKSYLDHLTQCKVFVMSSWVESFGLVAWEALEMGIPIVVSKDSGLYKYLEEEFGYLLRGLCGSFQVGTKLTSEKLGEAVADILLSEKVEQSAEKLRLEMIKQNRWEKCAIKIAKAIGIKDVMSDEVFTDSSYVGFVYSKREFMFDELKNQIKNKRINSKIVFFDGISNENILKDDDFIPSLYKLLCDNRDINVYLGYPTENALAERISQLDKESVNIENLKEKTKLIANLKKQFEGRLVEKEIDFEEETLKSVLKRIYLIPLDKSPNVYINIVDDDWYFTIKYEKRSSDNATIKLRGDGSKEGQRQKESLKEYMEFILNASQDSEGKKRMLNELKEW